MTTAQLEAWKMETSSGIYDSVVKHWEYLIRTLRLDPIFFNGLNTRWCNVSRQSPGLSNFQTVSEWLMWMANTCHLFVHQKVFLRRIPVGSGRDMRNAGGAWRAPPVYQTGGDHSCYLDQLVLLRLSYYMISQSSAKRMPYFTRIILQ